MNPDLEFPLGRHPLPGRSVEALRTPPASIGLWFFIAVATSLFSLFIVAYAMRMDAPDWNRIALPWQVWPATALLVAGSVAMARAARIARQASRHLVVSGVAPGAVGSTGVAVRSDETALAPAFRALRWGGVAAIGFVLFQLWGWQALVAANVLPAGNPSSGFFYMLTAVHGLHVLGGLAGWGVAWWAPHHGLAATWRLRLCGRYWHFLLAVWLVLLAALGWLTPAIVRAICGTDQG